MNLTDPKIDARIREALKDADAKGKLSVVSAVTGFAGGEVALRKIIKGKGELSLMDRAMLGIHLAGETSTAPERPASVVDTGLEDWECPECGHEWTASSIYDCPECGHPFPVVAGTFD